MSRSPVPAPKPAGPRRSGGGRRLATCRARPRGDPHPQGWNEEEEPARRLAERRAAPRRERRPLPRSTGGPRQRRRAQRGDRNQPGFDYRSAVRADTRRETRSRCDRRRRGVRAQLCLAVAPPRQSHRVRSSVKTNMRSLPAPVAGSERPSATALFHPGASRGRPAPAEGVRPDAAGRQGKAFPPRLPIYIIGFSRWDLTAINASDNADK